MLWNNIKIECKKAMGTRLFLFVVLTGCIITMFSLVPCVQSYNRYISSLKYISEEFSYSNIKHIITSHNFCSIFYRFFSDFSIARLGFVLYLHNL